MSVTIDGLMRDAEMSVKCPDSSESASTMLHTIPA